MNFLAQVCAEEDNAQPIIADKTSTKKAPKKKKRHTSKTISHSKKHENPSMQSEKTTNKYKKAIDASPIDIKNSTHKNNLSSAIDIPLPINEKLSVFDKELIDRIKKMNETSFSAHQNSHSIKSHHDKRPDETPLIFEADASHLSFSGHHIPGMALIHFLGDYWLFFDKKYPLTPPRTLPYGLESLKDLSTEKNNIFKLSLQKDFWPIMSSTQTHQGQKWSITFSKTPWMNRTKKVIRWPKTVDDPVKILMPSYSSEIYWQHPETKISLAIFTSKKQDSTFTPRQDFPQFNIIESYAGLALQPKSDSLVAKRDVEDLNLFDAKGLTMSESFLNNDPSPLFFHDKRSPYKINAELQSLKNKPQNVDNLMRQIQLGLHLGFFSEVSILIKKLESCCALGKWSEQGKFDIMRLALFTLSPHDENIPSIPNFSNHTRQSPEFSFWYNLYRRTPQNYEEFISPILSKYPIFLKNKIAEILLELPDEYANLQSLLSLKGLHHDLIERARLKLALMPPVDLRELDELCQTSKQREVQAKATLQILLEKQKELLESREKGVFSKEKEEDFRDTAIKDLEAFLFSFGDKTFQAKSLLARLYIEKKNYPKAILIFKDLNQQSTEHENDLKESMKKAYLNFFQDLSLKKENKPGFENFKVHPLDIVAFYSDFQQLTPEGAEGEKILDHVVEALHDLGLYNQAIEILNKRIEQHKGQSDQATLLLKVATYYKENDDLESAEKSLMTLEKDSLTLNDQQKYQKLLVDIHREKKEFSKALDDIGDKSDTESLLQKEEIYWDVKNFEAILKTTPPLIRQTTDPLKKAELAAHVAIANVLVKNPYFSYINLRKDYQSIVKGTPFEHDFMMATTPEININEGLLRFSDLDPLLKKE